MQVQTQMAPFHGEAKKHSGFDLYGGVFNSRIFGPVKFDKSSSRPKESKSNKVENQGNQTRSDLKSQVSEDRKDNSLKDLNVKELGTQKLAPKCSTTARNVTLAKQDSSQLSPSDFSSDNSFRSSPSSDSFSLSRKSSDASTCSSCGSGSVKGTSLITATPVVNGTRHLSGEFISGSGSSFNGGSPTEYRGRTPGFLRSRSTGSFLGSGSKPGNNNLGKASFNAGFAKSSSSSDCPPSKSGYSSGSSGELNGGIKRVPAAATVPTVLPMGNILPNGKLTSGAKAPAKSDQVRTCNVLGSGNGHYGHGSVMRGYARTKATGNIQAAAESVVMKRILRSSNPDEVKNAGNEQYKKGNFAEALLLYERAIVLSPGHALYHSNKSAAHTGLGQLGDAIRECEEAVRLDPSYSRAHQRLASLFLRLGEIENAKKHFKLAGQGSDWDDIQKLHAVEMHLSRCTEARRTGDWRALLKESNVAVKAGADSSPQIFACNAEALLKIHRVSDADAVMMSAPKIQLATSTKYFGILGSSYVHFVQAQVDMAQGRFGNACNNAEQAARLDLYNHEVSAFLRKAKIVAYARSTGNDLFQVGKFSEACIAYSEGLDNDPHNAILLCNRAACRFKLGHWEKAVEDCDAALSIQPNYTKALRRRADSNAKLERWEASLRDYEALRREMPGDVDVAKAFNDVQIAMKGLRGEEIKGLSLGEVQVISSSDQFRKTITSPGLAVVHFCTRASEKCRPVSPFMVQLCKKYPSVNFLKVDIEENLYLAKQEDVTAVPTFKIYMNGVKVEEIIGASLQVLEFSVKHYSL